MTHKSVNRHAAFLREATHYFETPDTLGEAFWANRQNAENCRKTADALESQSAELTHLRERATELEREGAAKILSTRDAVRVMRDAWRKSARRAEEFATQYPGSSEQWRAYGAMETAYAYADELDPEKHSIFEPCELTRLRKRNAELEKERDEAVKSTRLAERRETTARKFWIRDSWEALDGKPQALRNRLELCDLPPVRMEIDELDGSHLLVFEDEKRHQSDEQRIASLEATVRELREALVRARRYVADQNSAEGMLEGFGGRKPRMSDATLWAVDTAIASSESVLKSEGEDNDRD